MMKKVKKQKETLDYLKRVKIIGGIGIFVSIGLIIYDAYTYSNWMSVLSLIVDGLLLIFSIYFILKSKSLEKREKIAIEKIKNKKNKK